MYSTIKRTALTTVLFLSAAIAQAEVLSGASVFKELGTDQFAVGLYLDTPAEDISQIVSSYGDRRLEVRLMNDFSKRRWFSLWMQNISINISRDLLSKHAEQLVGMMNQVKGGLKSGDSFILRDQAGKGVSLEVNGVELANSLDKSIFDMFVYSLAGSIPPSNEFRAQILGKQRHPDVEISLATLVPTPARVELVKGWAAPAEEPVEVKKEEVKPVQVAEAKPEPKPEPKPVVETKPEPAPQQVAAVQKPVAKPKVEAKPEPVVVEEEEEDDVQLTVESALAQQVYNSDVMRQIYREIRYPRAAISRNWEGTVRLQVRVDREGKLLGATVLEGSEFTVLNKEAERAVKAAVEEQDFPQVPEAINGEDYAIAIPIVFRLQDG